MPVAKLKQYLKDDVPEFASKVSDYLYTYTTRREEVVQVQGFLPEDRLQVSMTDAADFVQISLGKLSSPLTVKVTLTYQDLLQVLPTRVTFHTFIDDDMEIPENFKEEQVLKWKQQLKIMPLSITMKAVSDAFQFVELENERKEREEEEEEDST
ncbi:uncharacterized protein [Argopecten irradians]|uniref:uncharacterized protein n=1 Tax=Argopecten irradians TaxID=31199 RepID=UPI00371E7329